MNLRVKHKIQKIFVYFRFYLRDLLFRVDYNGRNERFFRILKTAYPQAREWGNNRPRAVKQVLYGLLPIKNKDQKKEMKNEKDFSSFNYDRRRFDNNRGSYRLRTRRRRKCSRTQVCRPVYLPRQNLHR